MRIAFVFRDGNKIAAMIGPDLVKGLAGFGDTPGAALRDLADGFDKHEYQLRGNCVGAEAAGRFIQASAGPNENPADAIRALADIVERDGYTEHDFSPPDWAMIAKEEGLVSRGYDRN